MSEKTHSKRPSKKTKKSSSSSTKAVAEAPVSIPDVSEVLPVVEAVAVACDSVVAPATTTRSRATRESILEQFDSLSSFVSEEFKSSQENKTRVVNARTFRNIERDLKKLRTDCSRVMKGKKRATSGNANGGFMKPVRISKAMSKFTGWNPEELKSRVDVTKFICDYVSTNNLQNPSDRRQIIADKKLAKLLDYDVARDEKPLTYFFLQKKLQPHFEKPTATTTA